MERLDKTVATCGDMARSDAIRLIRRGQVQVDGEVCRDPSYKLDTAAHEVTVSGAVLDCRPHRYVMMNKPQGVLCVSNDPHAKTVVDLLPDHLRRKGMFPAGRLDKDTVGLVLLTDDGEYAHRLTSPKKAVFKHYLAVVDGEMPKEAVDIFAKGTTLSDGTQCLPAALFIHPLDKIWENEKSFRHFSNRYHLPERAAYGLVEISVQEGRYHQIKRMCESVDHKVLWLKRLSIGGLLLDDNLAEGECRELSEEEVAAVFSRVEEFCAF